MRCARTLATVTVTPTELGLGAVCCTLAGLLAGAMWEVRRLHRVCMRAWMFQASAQDQAETQRQLGALQATRGEVLEAAIGAAKLSQLDALWPQEMPPRNQHEQGPENPADRP